MSYLVQHINAYGRFAITSYVGFTYPLTQAFVLKQGNDRDRLFKDHLVYPEYQCAFHTLSRPCLRSERKTGSEIESGLEMEPKPYFLYSYFEFFCGQS